MRGLKSAQRKLSNFGNGIKSIGTKLMGLGALITAPLIAGAKSAASAGAALWDMSERTGMSVENLSKLAFAAQMTGTDIESLEVGVKRMQKAIVAASQGNKQAADALGELGLSAEKLMGLSPDEQFAMIGEGLAAIPDPTLKAATALQLFGRSGTMLLPMLEKLGTYSKAAENLGFVRSKESARAAKELSVILQILGKSVKSLWMALGTAIMPTLKQWSSRIIEIVLSARDWVKANKDLIVSVFKVAVGVTLAGAALVAVGYAIIGLSKVFGVLVGVCGAIHTALGILGTIIGWLLTPIGALITFIAAIGVIFLKATGAIDASLGAIVDGFKGLVEDARTAFGAIAKALSGGDIALAAEILWLLLKLEWTKGIGALNNAWGEFWTKIKLTANDAWTGLLVCWENLVHGMTKLLLNAGTLWDKALAHTEGFLEDLATGAKQIGQEIAINMNPTLSGEEKDKQIQAVRLQALPEWEKTDAKRQAALKAADEMNALALKGAEEVHNKEMANILAEGDQRDKQIAGELAKRKADVESEIAAARAKLTAAEEKANSTDSKWNGPGKGLDIDAWLKKMNVSMDELDATLASKDKVIGTFNASAAWGLGQNSAADRTARATEETARNTKKLLAKETPVLTFGS